MTETAYDVMSAAEEAMPALDAQPDQPVPPGGKVVTLPSGYRVTLRGARTIRNRDRSSLFDGVDFEASKMQAGFTVLANILRLLIVAWDVRDFDDATGEPVGEVLPIPSATADDVLGLLSMEDAGVLDGEAQKVQKLLMPNFEPDPDPASPTRPSAG